MCSELGLGSQQASTVGSLETIFNSFKCYLLSQVVTYYMFLGFRNPSVIFIQDNYFHGDLHAIFLLVALCYILLYYYYHSQIIYGYDNIMYFHSLSEIKDMYKQYV